jgi:hypothetical protein
MTATAEPLSRPADYLLAFRERDPAPNAPDPALAA